MKESRLFKILYCLLDKGHTTAPDLAEKFEVSVRTIYRDIDALSSAGIPVYSETGRNGGIYLMNNFVLDKAVLSENEKQEILTALQSLNATQNINNSATLGKLSALFKSDSEDWLEVDFSRWGNRNNDNEKFELFKQAVINRKCVKIIYAGSSEIISERVIQPLKLMYKSMSWYLKAFCTKRQEYRLFKLTRILDFEILDEGFESRLFPKSENTPLHMQNEMIKLRFPKEMTYRVYDEFDRDDVDRLENGDLIVSADMPQDAWLVGYIFSFGTQVEIIEPAHLRKAVAQKAKEIYEKNKT